MKHATLRVKKSACMEAMRCTRYVTALVWTGLKAHMAATHSGKKPAIS